MFPQGRRGEQKFLSDAEAREPVEPGSTPIVAQPCGSAGALRLSQWPRGRTFGAERKPPVGSGPGRSTSGGGWRDRALDRGLWVIKMPSWSNIKRFGRYHSTCYLRGALQLRSNHGYPCLCDGGLPAYPFPATSQTRLGSRRSSPANRRLEAEAAPAPTGSPRSAVLDCAPPAVGGLVRSPDPRQAGDRGFLASCRIPAVVAVAVSATPTGATKAA